MSKIILFHRLAIISTLAYFSYNRVKSLKHLPHIVIPGSTRLHSEFAVSDESRIQSDSCNMI